MSRFAFFLLALLLATRPCAAVVIAVFGGTALNADDAGAVAIIEQDGSATVLGTPIPGESLTGVVQLPDGRVVASTATFLGPSRLIEIDPTTGALVEEIGPFLSGTDPVTIHDLAANPATGVLYGVATGDEDRGEGSGPEGGPAISRNTIFAIDPDTGACTFLGSPASTGDFMAIAFSTVDGNLWGMRANSSTLLRMDPVTTQVTQTIGSIKNLDTGALGMMEAGSAISFLISGCCQDNNGNDLYIVETQAFFGGLYGSVGGTRRVHDLAGVIVEPGPGPAPLIVEVPTLEGAGTLALALLLGAAGALLLWRR